MITYGKAAWRPGSHIVGVKPDVVAAELAKLGPNVTTEAFKEQQRPADSPAHDAIFDCPIEEAAELHYSRNAAHLIRCLVVVEENDPEAYIEKYVYVRSEKSYAETAVVVQRVDRWEDALFETRRDLSGAAAKLRRLQRFAAEYDPPPKERRRVDQAVKAVDRAVAVLTPA